MHPNSLGLIAPKLARLLPVLGSDKPGEVVNAAAAISRTLAAAGTDWHDLTALLTAAPAPPQGITPHQGATPQSRPGSVTSWGAAHRLLENPALLNDWEHGFVSSVLSQMVAGKRLSGKQATTLMRIYRQRHRGGR
ncbi:hypothetical protein D3869_16860 (plasmid) [Azospirillum brasilense]|uniref:Uncharacterized protein n=2 Tax=Azospirillum brasilense TaxID=192 RepID=A0A4D8R856_AZOBR|nr:hypothetical protein D3869_16860 [Azospirillum brasilense]